MRRRVLMVTTFSVSVVIVAASACSSFSEPEPAPDDRGDAGVDAPVPVMDATPDVMDGGLEAEADAGDGFPRTPLVHIPAAKPYDIEAREVTVEQYSLFKARFPAPTSFPARCPGKTTLGPRAGGCNAQIKDSDPMSCVDWCDAQAYCTAIGRHLCGDIAGGVLTATQYTDALSDQWYRACRGPNGLAFPYGEDPDAGACNTASGAPLAPGSKSTCVGAEPGLFDMSGNIREWEDACDNATSAIHCMVRGGSFLSDVQNSTCAAFDMQETLVAFKDLGFRCCVGP